MAAGRLDVLLGLDAAEFTKGLTKAEYEAKAFSDSMLKLGGQIGTALGAGALAAATAIGYMTKSAIDAADHLNDLSKATGVSVENLGGIGFAASQAGSDLDTAASALGKLNLKIAEAARGEKEASEAFKALGISVKDAAGNTKSADKIFTEIATAFEQYADGPEKAALSNAFFSKSYKEMAPLLADGGKALQQNIEYFNKYGGVTTEVAKKADEFNDTLGKLTLQSKAFGNALLRELIDPLQVVANEMLKAAEQTTLLSDAATLAKDTFVFFVDKVANAVANLKIAGIIVAEFAAKVKSISEGDLPDSTRFDAISKAAKEDVDRAIKELDRFKAALKNSAAPPVKGIGLESLDAMFKDKPAGKPAPALGGGTTGNANKEKIDESTQAYARYVEQLSSGLEKEQQLSKVQEVTRAIEQNRFGELIPQQKELLLLLAAQADAADEYTAKIKHLADVEREENRKRQERADFIDQATGRKADREALQRLKWLDEDLASGAIELEDYTKAQKTFWDGAAEGAKKADEATEQFGLTFASALGDFITNPQSGKTFFQALLEDLLQLTTQMLVVQPIAKLLKDTLSGMTSGGSGYGSLLSSLFGSGGGSQNLVGVFAGGTDYVSRDGLAMVHRGEKIVTAQDNASGKGGGGMTLVLNQSFAPGTSRETVNQAAAAAAQRLQMANRRNN